MDSRLPWKTERFISLDQTDSGTYARRSTSHTTKFKQKKTHKVFSQAVCVAVVDLDTTYPERINCTYGRRSKVMSLELLLKSWNSVCGMSLQMLLYLLVGTLVVCVFTPLSLFLPRSADPPEDEFDGMLDDAPTTPPNMYGEE